ncbi:Protein of unknown function [Lactobacillus delbrueckii subsp. bulgaricus]|nr:Protein of unknown function [Lactobacillus delbrueckii subsp. bulgaricus]
MEKAVAIDGVDLMGSMGANRPGFCRDWPNGQALRFHLRQQE